MTNYLPDNASFENLKNQAKTLLKRVHAGDEEIVANIRKLYPHLAERELSSFKLAECQLFLARHYGFNTWAELKRALDTEDDAADRFLRAAILNYGGMFAKDIDRAKQVLQEHPSLAEDNIWVAAALGNVAVVERQVKEQPELSNAQGGPYDHTPLLYLCYSRLHLDGEAYDALATAKLLLDQGADAAAHYLTHGTYVFTCVTGAIGEGENGMVVCPPHPQAEALATLLLEHGANPNDSQGLYNSMFTGGTHWIQLLLDHGLKQGDPINWAEKDGVTTLDYLLAHAAKRNMVDRVELLLEHGADPNCRDWYEKKPVYELALGNGNTQVVELLIQHGAKPIKPSSPKQAFYNACVAVDRESVDRIMTQHSNDEIHAWIAESQKHMGLAAEADKLESVRYMLELGFPIGHALFEAAWSGRLEMARLLVEHGARVGERHPDHGATPIAYADRAGQDDVFDFLMEQEVDIFDAVRFGDVAKIQETLEKNPEGINHRYRDYCAPSTQSDWLEHTPLTHAVATGRDENACWLLANGADASVKVGKHSVLELAKKHGCQRLTEELS